VKFTIWIAGRQSKGSIPEKRGHWPASEDIPFPYRTLPNPNH